MKFDVEQQLNLVALAALDQELSQLTNRAKNHPVREEIAKFNDELEKIQFEITQINAKESDIQKEAKKLELEIEQVQNRLIKDKARIDSVSNAKELAAMEHEVQSLQSRQNELENQEIVMLEEIESLQTEQAKWQNEIDKLSKLIEEKTQVLKAALADLKNEAERVNKDKQDLVVKINSDLMAKYQKILSEHVGLAAARLVDGACTGCNISFSPIEVQEIKANDPELIMNCENCGCILVRA